MVMMPAFQAGDGSSILLSHTIKDAPSNYKFKRKFLIWWKIVLKFMRLVNWNSAYRAYVRAKERLSRSNVE